MRRLSKLFRIAKWGVLAMIAATALFVGTAMTYGALRDRERLIIQSPKGIDEGMFVSIGGLDQWIQIRGQDRDNPVLLMVHGGPGLSSIPSTPAFLDWEKHFTLVMWDQRGDGLSFWKSGPSVADTMTMERMAADGIEVAEFLRKRLKKDKVVLLGHSWGAMLGVRMASARPDLFFAYVGTGQNVNLQRALPIGYWDVLAKARAARNTSAVAALEAVGPPPYTDSEKNWVPIGWENRLDAPPPPFSLAGFGNLLSNAVFRPYLRRSAEMSQNRMLPAMLAEDAPSVATHFDLPIVFIQGETDIITPTALAREYFDRIDAPKKEFVVIPGAGHLAIFSARDAFLKELLARVRPLAVQ